MIFNRKRKNKENGAPLYADITNRLFALSVDLVILYMPLKFLTEYAAGFFFPVTNQFGVTMAKVANAHPEFSGNLSALTAYMAQDYPHDTEIIIRQFVFATIVQIILLGVYIIPFTYKYGATPGKMLLGMKIIDKTGAEEISMSQAIIRYIACVFLGFEIMFAGIRRDRRCWHDLAADTMVIYTPNRWYKRYKDKFATKFKAYFNIK